MYSHQLLIKNLLETPVASNPQQEIVYKNKYRFTYLEFHQRVKKLANLLHSLGIKKGDTVGVMDYDSHRYLELYFAVPMIGAVLHMVNIRLSPEQILYTIDHAEDDILLVHQDFIPIIEQIKGRLDSVKSFVSLGQESVDSHIHFEGEYETMLAQHNALYEFPIFDENTRATTFYTTGTTGMPRGVYFSHRQLVLHTLGVTSSLSSSLAQNFTQNDVYMPITPMFHVHAWGLPYVATFLGVKQVYPGKYIPDNLLGLIETEEVTFSHCVPTILHMLLHSKKIDSIDLSRWKVIIGGASFPKAMCKTALQKGIDIFTGYGMSETCPILTLAQITKEDVNASIDDQVNIRVKTGKPLGLVELKLVDENMQDIQHDGEQTGELIVRSPWLTQGYFKDERHSSKLWEGGYLHTGDVANCDEKGYFKITDRSKDVIKVSGEWVSSLEIEDIINQHESVTEVAVIAQPHEKWGEIPLALVVCNQPHDKTLERNILHHTKEFIKKGIMARESTLVKLKFVETIDKTSVGKIDKRTLREKHL